MKIEMLIEKLQDVVDNAFTLPLSGGKTVVDTEELKKIIDEMRNNLPQELRQAKNIANERTSIINKAKEEAEQIVRQAEERGKALVSQSEIVRNAQREADEIIFNADKKAENIQKAIDKYIDDVMSKTEKSLSDTLGNFKDKRKALDEVRKNKNTENKKESKND